MICPYCHQETNDSFCASCGRDLDSNKWVCIKTVYPPNDIIIESLLTSSGIPVKFINRNISQIPVTIGPAAEVKILVPQEKSQEAALILNSLEQSLPEE
jgi:hypothetical protein